MSSDTNKAGTFGSFGITRGNINNNNNSASINKVGRPRILDLYRPFQIVSDITHLADYNSYQGKSREHQKFLS